MERETLTCKDERRRQGVRDKGLNGIDYVEIIDDKTQTELCVHLFREPPQDLREGNVRIDGGQRVRDIAIVKIERPPDSESDDCLRITVDKPGDFSLYSLRLVELEDSRPTDKPYHGFDPRYSKIQFSFKVGCPSDLDCKTEAVCPPEKRDEPEINYLAKDYSSFRQLILDRLALIMPDWQERHVPDIGIALVELLAYVGDYLSYYQDAVATEAYLNTARQRISVRRHARLVDYQMHEGCNARAFVTVTTNEDGAEPKLKFGDIYFTTAPDDGKFEVFEPLVEDPEAPVQLYAAHSTINFYTWGNEECCLPRGARSATLKDDWVRESSTEFSERPRKLHLKAGEVLIFEEIIGPKTGDPADANPSCRWAVRLTKIERSVDPLNDQPIVEIEWVAEDALPFPFCLSARLPAPDCSLIKDISVAHGNVILVDHGKTIDEPEDLGQVGRKTSVGQCECEGSAIDITYLPEIFEPVLKQIPLTFSEPLRSNLPASKMLIQDPRKALPQVTLTSLPGACPEPGTLDKPKPQEGIDPKDERWRWHSKCDLLESWSQDKDFVVEIDDEGRAHLRFGDGDVGRRPEACMIFSARYRVGNGPAGNVGVDTITTFVVRNQTVSGMTLRPRNPLPAQGGTPHEPVAEVKLFAPGAFRKVLQRAIIADDYARIVEREFKDKIQRAGASLRWTGSWYEVQVAVDPRGTEEVDEALLREITGRLHRYRRMGYDLRVVAARYIPLEIELTVCVLPHYLRGHVEAALLDVFSNRVLPEGRLGLFHPDSLTFGEGIYLSKLVAAAQAVPGVESVQVTTLQRLGEGNQGELDAGILKLSPLEVAQLDNDPSFPEHGVLALKIGGGR